MTTKTGPQDVATAVAKLKAEMESPEMAKALGEFAARPAPEPEPPTTIRMVRYKAHKAASEETAAFEAVLQVGSVFADVVNRGTGGMNEYHWWRPGTPDWAGRTARLEYREAAIDWAKVAGIAANSEGQTMDAQDLYLAYLAQEYDVAKAARKHRKDGFPLCLRLTRGQETVAVVGAREIPKAGDQELDQLLKRFKATGYEVMR